MLADNKRFRDLSREYSQLDPVTKAMSAHEQAQRDLAAAHAMRNDPEMRELADEEIPAAEARIAALDAELGLLLIPKDPRDEGNLFLEVRAGTGGDEAAIFAGDLFRMYARYAERQRWKVEIESASPGEHGGYKEIVARIEGRGAYSKLKFESGTHRVQRVPDTETQGRIHTSAATVAILPDYEEVERDRDQPRRLARGHLSQLGRRWPARQQDRIGDPHHPRAQRHRRRMPDRTFSQHANRDKAMQRLKAALLEGERAKAEAATAASRRLQVGSGDRSQRIRTYNFPQGRITDHRVEGLTLYDLPNVLAGDMDDLVDRLTREHQADELKLLTEAA